MDKIDNFINGQLCPPISAHYIDNISPATGEIYGQIPNSDENDLSIAIAAAKQAQADWANMASEQRSDILNKIAQLIEKNLEQLAEAESIDNGKPISVARAVDIPRAASNFKFFASASSQFASQSHQMAGNAINYTLRQPLGIVGCISPWNLPLYLFTWKIAPALAAGNCVIAKPSEVTPKTASLFAMLCQQAGLPDGVLSILHGKGQDIGKLICEHPDISAISFTGGTQTGAQIATSLAPTFKKLSLELGGKNPAIIMNDCDFEQTLNEVFRASFANQGQICLCASRLYIQRDLYEKFKSALVEKAKLLVPRDPLNPTTMMGAIVSKAHLEKILSFVQLAKHDGAKILAGGEQATLSGSLKNGYYMQPTVIEGLSAKHACNQQEIFGPVVTLTPFNTLEEAISLANDNDYGLASTVWTTNINTAHIAAEQLKTGIVWINCWLHRDLRTPFGGMKNSGLGREGGEEAMRFFTETKNVCIKYT